MERVLVSDQIYEIRDNLGKILLIDKMDLPDALYHLLVPPLNANSYFCAESSPMAYRVDRIGAKVKINPSFANLDKDQQRLAIEVAAEILCNAKTRSLEVSKLDDMTFMAVVLGIAKLI